MSALVSSRGDGEDAANVFEAMPGQTTAQVGKAKAAEGFGGKSREGTRAAEVLAQGAELRHPDGKGQASVTCQFRAASGGIV